MTVENKSFEELSGDQRREFVNTQQRFDAFLDAQVRSDGYRGSMSFSTVGGSDYLVRSYYDPKSGSRRQKSLGPRDAENERIKAQFETGRHAATERLAAMRQSIERQAGLIRPMRSPPWRDERTSVAEPETDLDAVQIEGLIWNENAPAFRAVAIDQRGFPLRIVAPDPRAFAVHKFWLSRRLDRDPVKKTRDAAQARAVATLVARFMPHLPFRPEDLRSFPKAVVGEAALLFAGSPNPAERFDW